MQLGMSLNFDAIDKVPANILNKFLNSNPQICMHRPAIARSMPGLLVERVSDIGVIRVESIHIVVGDSMPEVHVESICTRSGKGSWAQADLIRKPISFR